MIRTCQVKLENSPTAETVLDGVLEPLRQLYNACLEQRIDAWRKQRKSLSRYDQQKELTALRAADRTFAALPAEMTRSTVTTRIDLAFRAFHRRCRSGQTPGFPRFRGRGRFQTLIFGTEAWKIRGKHLILRFGDVVGGEIRLRMKNTLHRGGQIRGLRLVRRGEHWWAHFLVDIGPAPLVKPSRHGVGIDVGLRTFATLSDGMSISHPRFLRQAMTSITAAQQALSRCHVGSHRQQRRKRELGRLHARVAHRRRDFLRQTVADLVQRYDGFAVEDLDIAEMASCERTPPLMTRAGARGLRRGIMDSGWRSFIAQLESKAEEAGYPVVQVNPKGTTQRCSGCGSLVRKGLGDRVHDCAACGLRIDRDWNAARNIYDRGWRSAIGEDPLADAEASS